MDALDGARRGRLARLLRDERGGMSLLGIGMMAMFILLAIYLFYFYTVFIEKRQAQNVADAAALAAVETIKELYEEALEQEAGAQARKLHEGEQEARRTPEPTPTSVPTPTPSSPAGGLPDATATPTSTPTPSAPPSERGEFDDERLYDEIVEEERFRDADWLSDNWMRIVRERYFADSFTATRNGDLLYDTVKRHSGRISAAARETARRNEGLPNGGLEFPYERKPKFLLESGRTITLETIGIRSDLTAKAAAALGSKEIPIDVSSKVPMMIYW
ncbi:pilus assembly protein TadG-related protein [Paenibacillus sp. B01]|uniref:pilus assembly protein TadG-related protein n=1 Tax=Paenibacillus sp. B01 TaxID=2660554 RepID=UPI001890CE54|nr:pilus assembly protein TadG-related protein [Paenibacillus sp. B01]